MPPEPNAGVQAHDDEGTLGELGRDHDFPGVGIQRIRARIDGQVDAAVDIRRQGSAEVTRHLAAGSEGGIQAAIGVVADQREVDCGAGSLGRSRAGHAYLAVGLGHGPAVVIAAVDVSSDHTPGPARLTGPESGQE
jgi:hypothetical protein